MGRAGASSSRRRGRTLVELRQEARDLGGVVLAVGVDRDDHVAGGLREARGERGGLAEVPAQTDCPHVRCARVQTGEGAERPVGRAVVDEHDLPGAPERVERARDLVVEELDTSLLVVHRHDDREHVARVPGTRVPT